jgi:hypothetical protein
MSPQLTVQQLEHAIANIQKRVEAKRLEVEACAELRDCAQAVLADLLDHTVSAEREYHGRARLALANLFAAKHAAATIDLEELELNLRAYQQMRSGVVGASRVIDPFKSNQRH